MFQTTFKQGLDVHSDTLKPEEIEELWAMFRLDMHKAVDYIFDNKLRYHLMFEAGPGEDRLDTQVLGNAPNTLAVKMMMDFLGGTRAFPNHTDIHAKS